LSPISSWRLVDDEATAELGDLNRTRPGSVKYVERKGIH
jgi:hypothetical protein